jgi:hypothetical protein
MPRTLLALLVTLPAMALAQTRPAPTTVQPRLDKPLRLADSFTMPIFNGCVYNATVRGVVTPTAVSEAEQRLLPDLVVMSSLTCPNKPVVKVSDSVSRTGPLTLEQVEAALERRGSVSADSGGGGCLFQPDFELDQNGLTGVSVTYLCPADPAR